MINTPEVKCKKITDKIWKAMAKVYYTKGK